MQQPQKIVENHVINEVKKNMEMPEALRFRSNTGNRAYGFEQTFK